MASVTGNGALTAPKATLTASGHKGVHASGALFAPSPPVLSATTSMVSNVTWEQMEGQWGEAESIRAESRPVMLVGDEFYQVDRGVKYQEEGIKVSLVRTGLVIFGRDRSGNWKIDPTIIKEVLGIYPIIRGIAGTVVQVYLGSQDAPDDPVYWEGPRDFVVGQDYFVDVTVSGRYLAVKFESSGQPPWELLSYDLELAVIGGH